MLKQAESRLNQEKESILAEQRGQNLLLANLKSIQVLLEAHVNSHCWESNVTLIISMFPRQVTSVFYM